MTVVIIISDKYKLSDQLHRPGKIHSSVFLFFMSNCRRIVSDDCATHL